MSESLNIVDVHELIGDAARKLQKGRVTAQYALGMAALMRVELRAHEATLNYHKTIGGPTPPSITAFLPVPPESPVTAEDRHRIANKALDALGGTPGK